MAKIIDGKEIASRIETELANTVKNTVDRKPSLAVILVGARPDSAVYVKMKQRTASRIGIDCKVLEYPDSVDQIVIEEQISVLNEDATVDGIIVQLPLSPHLDSTKLVQMVAPKKDVDGLHQQNLGALLSVKNVPYHVPCTPQAVIELLDATGVQLIGAHVVLVGCGELVGRPLALCLLRRNATVSCCHSETRDIESITRQGDIIVAAAGRPMLVKRDWVKPGAVVIDVGINSVLSGEGKPKLVGDVDYDNVKQIASAITPVPGGVGPMTVVMLMKAVVKAWNANRLLQQELLAK